MEKTNFYEASKSFSINDFNEVIDYLSTEDLASGDINEVNDEELDEKHKDHALINDRTYKNCRECHIEPDWLLVWEQDDFRLTLLFLHTGTHSDIF